MTGDQPVRVRGRANTPDLAGYMIAVVVAIGVTVLVLALGNASSHDVGGTAAALLVLSVYVTVFAVPTALVGVPLVHLSCRGVSAQWVHVVAAGLAGVLTGLAFVVWVGGLFGDFEALWMAPLIGFATAVGRAAVIPLRPPVDDDFVTERPAC